MEIFGGDTLDGFGDEAGRFKPAREASDGDAQAPEFIAIVQDFPREEGIAATDGKGELILFEDGAHLFGDEELVEGAANIEEGGTVGGFASAGGILGEGHHFLKLCIALVSEFSAEFQRSLAWVGKPTEAQERTFFGEMKFGSVHRSGDQSVPEGAA